MRGRGEGGEHRPVRIRSGTLMLGWDSGPGTGPGSGDRCFGRRGAWLWRPKMCVCVRARAHCVRTDKTFTLVLPSPRVARVRCACVRCACARGRRLGAGDGASGGAARVVGVRSAAGEHDLLHRKRDELLEPRGQLISRLVPLYARNDKAQRCGLEGFHGRG